MKLGINWSGLRDLQAVTRLISERQVDFVEILIDNFLHCPPDSIAQILDGTDCAFHIMNSRFLHSDPSTLASMANSIKFLQEELKPIYISDHLGKFYHNGHCFPQMLEVEYGKDLEICKSRLNIWQDMLNSVIYIENYPSIIHQQFKQPDFFAELIDQTKCKLLFDISNAIVSQINIGTSIRKWNHLLKDTSHFHIAGYAPTSFSHEFVVDTHDCAISQESLSHSKDLLASRHKITISVERDDNFDVEAWRADLSAIRRFHNDL